MAKKKHPDPERRGAFIDDLRRKQQNILWPDTLRYGRSIDKFLLKGSAHPPIVQKIGAWLIGIWMLLLGGVLLGLTIQARGWVGILVGIVAIVGAVIISGNGFSKTRANKKPGATGRLGTKRRK
jgi:hypothetical protein